ncbi:MAG: sigma-70 family RNA polymerase sigma factor [Clostridiales bacterium]|nr:sigma-70 family RNA polymerase sigma factor [Clostridiales bacterium]
MIDECISRYGKRIFGLCLKLCKNSMDAEDLYQETWIKAYRFIDKYDNAREFEGWLTSICLNAYRDMLRRQRWKSMLAVFKSNEEKDFVMNSLPAETEDNYSHVREAVNELPEKCRMATILYYFNDMDVKKVAEILKMPEGTVKSHLSKARKILKERLEPNG